jgi:arylsulfatase A-like enzyme
MRKISFCMMILLAAVVLGPRNAWSQDQPNIVWLLSEDNSIHYTTLYGSNFGEMPNIEALARDGLVFNHAFSCSPVCSVARSTLMTGIYAPRAGFQYHRKQVLANLPAKAQLLPVYLRQAGYYTSNRVKTDYNIVAGKVWNDSSRQASWRKRPDKATPFFHMQSFGMSHESSLHFSQQQMNQMKTVTSPRSVSIFPYHPDTSISRYTYARYHDRMQVVDEAMGRVIDMLREDDLLDSTFIFYFGDHGGVLPRSKGYVYESGLHVPLVVHVPEKFRQMVSQQPGIRQDGFIRFVDLAPTALHLAGLDVPATMNGRPFLGPGVAAEEVEARDEAFGYADRFDEKYDFCRSLRKGKYKYIRNYHPYYPDGLQNNYRYRMLLYAEWRELFQAGTLNAEQSQFFQARPAEQLFDVEADPHEVKDLSGDPKCAEVLKDMRQRLRTQLLEINDLSFYPESYMAKHALADGVTFGEKHSRDIRQLLATADLALLPFGKASKKIAQAVDSDDPHVRYWGLVACSCFGRQAESLVPTAKELLEDPDQLVRVRAAEFLGIVGAADPAPTLLDVLATTEDGIEGLLALNTIVFLRDGPGQYKFHIDVTKIKAMTPLVTRRLEYLQVVPLEKK